MSVRRYSARLFTAALAGTLTLTAGQAAYAAPTSGTAAGAKGAPSAAGPLSSAQAATKARATGRPVPVDTATTQDSTLTANPDGSYTLTETPMPVRKKVGGAWKNLDATLVRNADGTLSPAAATFPLVLSGGGHGPLATMRQGADSLALTLPTTLPAPVLSGASATYPGVLPGVDLQVTANAQGGFSDVFIVKNAAAAHNPALASLLTASTASSGLTVTADAAGNLAAVDRHGHPLFTASAPTLWDSTASNTPTVASPGARPATSSVQRPGRAAHIGKLKPTVTAHAITLSPDPAVLTGTGINYPVYLDPAWYPGQSGWASISEYYPTQGYWDTTPDPGPEYYAQIGNSGSAWSHTLFNFRLDDADMAGAKIKSATLYLTEETAYSCTNSTVDVYAPSTVLDSNNANWAYWSGQNVGGVVGANSFAHGYSNCPAAGDSVTLNNSGLTTIANDVAAKKATQTLLLTGANESNDFNSWKEFLVNTTTSPQLSITYNHPPNTPTNLTMSPGGSCTGVTAGLGDVLLYAGVSDADGGTLGVAFNVYKTASPGTIIKSTSYTNGAANYLAATSNTTASLLIPKATLTAAAGGAPLSISWNVQLSDGSDTSGISKTCSFTFDATVPGAPSVTDTGQNSCGGLNYTVGTAASFTATSSSDITHYLFQLGSSAPISAQVANSNDPNHAATATITPTRHTNILSVSAVSAGGNIGDSAVCVINAAVPAFGAPTATPASNSPTDASAPGDLTGDAVPDVLAVGAQNDAPPGLWLAPGQTNGAVLPNALNIGLNGDGLNAAGTAADWTGTDVLTGQFTGTGFQDILALYTSGATASGSSTNGFVLAANGNDGSPLTNLGDNSTTYTVTSNTSCTTAGGLCTGLADKNGNIPIGDAQVANAGNLSTNGNTPDLLTLSTATLWLDPAASRPGVWQGGAGETALAVTNPYCSIAANNCTTGWNTWSITTALVGTGTNAQPALFARDNSTTSASAGQLWYYSPTALQDISNAALGGGSSNDLPVQIPTSGLGLSGPIQAANINGTIALRTYNSTYLTHLPVIDTYLLNTSTPTAPTLTLGPAAQTLNTASHSWALNDTSTATVNSVTYPTATDTSAGLNATAGGSQHASGAGTDAVWHTGDLFDPDIRLNTTGSGARMTSGTGSLATTGAAISTGNTFTASAWIKPADEYITETVLSQDGANGSGFDLYGDTNGAWNFALKNSDAAGGAFATVTGGTVQPGQWTLLTATYDASNAIMKLYQNGIEIASAAHTKVATGTGSSPWRIGADRTNASAPVTTHYFAGQIADVQTWNSVQPPAQAPTPGSYAVPVNPTRILDTRNATGVSTTTPVPAFGTLTLQVTGRTVTNPATGANYSVPTTGVTAVGLTLQVSESTAGGYITAYPDLTPRPFTSNLNFVTGQTESAYVLVPVGTDGKINLYNSAGGTVRLVADMTGYYTTDSSSALASTYNPIQPARILDTRSAYHIGGSTLAGYGTLTLAIDGADTKVLPTSGITAIAMNLTATNAASGGNLIAYPGNDTSAPTASSVNYNTGTTFATTDILPVGSGNTIKIYNNNTGSVDIIGDVTGYYTQSTAGQKYHPLAATRILDTRQTTALPALNTATIAAPSTIPDPGATIVLNITATNEQAGGNLTIYSGPNQPKTSNLNWPTSTSVANVTLATTSGGQTKLYNNSAGNIDLIADTNGYFSYTGTPAATNYAPSQTWNTGTSWSAGTNTVKFQASDGNLAIYNATGTEIWHTTASTQASTNTLTFSSTGGLQILNATGTVVWSSTTSGTAATLAFQPDGNLVLYDTNGNPLWATGTTNS